MFSNKDEDPKDKKVPSGFEKFLKKTKKQPPPPTEPVGEKDEPSAEPEKENKKKLKRDEEELSEEETEPAKEKETPKKSDGGARRQLNEFFMQSGGKGPRWENIGLVAFLTGAFGYYLATRGSPSEEITYIDFVNNYLAQGQCTMITISEDKSSDMFKFRAQIETADGRKVHLVLPQVENFLYKLDAA